MNTIARTALLATCLVMALIATAVPDASAQSLKSREDQVASSSQPDPHVRHGNNRTALDLTTLVDSYSLAGYTLMEAHLFIFDGSYPGSVLLRDTRADSAICQSVGGGSAVFGGALQATGPNSFVVDGVVNCLSGPNTIFMFDQVRHYKYDTKNHQVISSTGDVFAA